MPRAETIVVGGGIGAGSPFDLNFVTIVGSVDPPLLITTPFMFTVPTGVTQGLILNDAGTDPAAGPEVLRVKGGTILFPASHATGTCIGDGADSGALGQIIIGAAPTPNAQANSIVIGNAAVGPSGGTGIVIGQGSSLQGASGVAINATCTAGGAAFGVYIQSACSGGAGGGVGIGGTHTTTTGLCAVGINSAVEASNGTAFGASATVREANGVAIGTGAIVLATHENSIAIGSSCQSIATRTFSVGSNVSGNSINQVIVGHGLNQIANPTPVLFRLTNAQGVDNVAGNMSMQPGLSTGAAIPGAFIVRQGVPVASGTTLQSAYDAFYLGSSTLVTAGVGIVITTPAASVQNPVLEFNFQAGTRQCLVGMAGQANGIIVGDVAGDLGLTANSRAINFSSDGRSSIAMAVAATTGIVNFNKDRGTRWNNATNSAAAGAGTLTNAPTAGDPAFWLKINVNGTAYSIPCWAE